MVTVAVVGILSGLAIVNYSQRLSQERLLASTRILHAWLDEHRRIAMQRGGACRLTIDSTSASLDPTGENVILPDGNTTPNVCANRTPLLLKETTESGEKIELKKNQSEASAIIFSFRGFSQIANADNNWSTDPELELRLFMPKVERERCIKLISPLGLIRDGYAASDESDCIYNSTY